jgi:hypothetical protein
MKFETYIKEENRADEKIKYQLTSLRETIKKECSQFIKEFDYLLFRGVILQSPLFRKYVPRTDRRPLDTPKEIHDILDAAFQKKFGWKVRSEGVFTTPSFTLSSVYGDSVIFFPIDGYKYVFSKTVSDVTTYLVDLGILSKDHTEKLFVDTQFTEEKAIEIVSTYKDSSYKSERTEIAFKCKEYYGIRVSLLRKMLNRIGVEGFYEGIKMKDFINILDRVKKEI